MEIILQYEHTVAILQIRWQIKFQTMAIQVMGTVFFLIFVFSKLKVHYFKFCNDAHQNAGGCTQNWTMN